MKKFTIEIFKGFRDLPIKLILIDGRAVYPILVLFELQVPTVWMKKAFEKPHPIRQGQNTGQQLFKHFPGYGHMP